MATFKTTCPTCDCVLKSTSPIQAGKPIQCPRCNTSFAVRAESPRSKPTSTKLKSNRTGFRSSVLLAVALAAILGLAAGAYFWLANRPTGTSNAATPGIQVKNEPQKAPPSKKDDPKPLPSSIKTTPENTSESSWFFSDGRTGWKIYLSSQADPTEVFAAEELRDALKKISGVTFEIVASDRPPARHAIVVGDLKNAAVQAQAQALKLEAGKVEQIAVYTLGERLYLAGNQPRGALYAVYHFLQHDLGVRWLWPGPDGEFMPVKKSWALPALKANHRPAFAYRGFHLCGDWRDVALFREWMGRNFINIYRHGAGPAEMRRGFYSMFSDHNATLPASLFQEHPEYFAEIKGKRYKSNICFGNPDVDKAVISRMKDALKKKPFIDILSIFPVDNENYCRCSECAKTDVSTAWFEFYNRVTDELKKEYPNLKFATIAYQGYRTLPKCKIRNSEFVEYASYSRCNVHPYGHPDCRSNEETMAAMRGWQGSGVPIGNYSYEYDIFSQNRRFTPFLSVIENAVKTSRELGHVAVIPEVLLHPKTGPDVNAHAIQNRLSIYLYARLLWDPDQTLQSLLDDWCKTVYREAAAPMREYFTSLDRTWTAMPAHAAILGNALRIAPVFVTDKLREETAASFAAAEMRLASIADPLARNRATDALTRERALLNQWQDLYRLTQATERLNLPHLVEAGAFPKTASPAQEFGNSPADTPGYSTSLRLAWTSDALLVHWTCSDRQMKNLKSQAADRDGKVSDDDSVELELSSGSSGETWHLAVNSKGIQHDWRQSDVGIRDDLWNPQWQATVRTTAQSWQVEMTVPFASLGQKPSASESWQARFLRHNGGRQDFAKAVFPKSETAALLFNALPRTDRSLVWWSGLPEREEKQNTAISQEFTENGWKIHLLANADHLHALKEPSDAYWFRHPNGANKVPADYWEKHLVPAVKNGATAVFVSFLDIPLDQYFRDPSLKVKLASCGPIPLAARTTTFLAPGEWSKRPHALEGSLKSKITPAYGFTPTDPSGWTVLASANGSTGPYPYLLMRRLGKGMIVLGGADMALPRAKLLENLIGHHEKSP